MPTLTQAASYAACALGLSAVLLHLVRRCIHALDKADQLFIQRLTQTDVINGPGLFFVSPFVKGATRRKAELLKPLDFILVKDQLTGRLNVVRGPALHFLAPFDEVLKRGEAFSLTAQEYLIIKDTQSGEKSVKKGPCVFVPGAYDETSSKLTALSLEPTHYARLRDKATGARWTVKGPALLVPEPTWEVVGGLQTAISLKRTEYVLRNRGGRPLEPDS